tara:strand:- start:6851 stop:7579 length:729 start_codon:yes stop_codon:yes gene_type:complete
MATSNDPNDCLSNGFGGIGHDYNYCIAPIEKTLLAYGPCEKWGTDCIARNVGGLFKYAGSLVYNPGMAISKQCKQKLGNKYLQKTGTKCKEEGTGQLRDRYVYINNMDTTNIITGRTSNSGSSGGIIPAAISSVTRLNPVGILSAITEDATPTCKKIKVKCHVLNDKQQLYRGPSPPVYIASEEIKDIERSRNKEKFSNLNETNELMYSLNKAKKDNKVDEFYYILLTAILLYLIYKLIHKK